MSERKIKSVTIDQQVLFPENHKIEIEYEDPCPKCNNGLIPNYTTKQNDYCSCPAGEALKKQEKDQMQQAQNQRLTDQMQTPVKEPEMYICPDAQQCSGGKFCMHKMRHEHTSMCGIFGKICPACVPVSSLTKQVPQFCNDKSCPG